VKNINYMAPYYVMFSVVLFEVLAAVTTNSDRVCDAVQSHRSAPRFRMNTLSPSSGSKYAKQTTRRKQAASSAHS
jgi:hypothetical protein